MDFEIKKLHITRQLSHIYDVQKYMILLELNREKLPFFIPEWEIIYRSMFHDSDKFKEQVANNYCKIRKYLKENNIKEINYDMILHNNLFNVVTFHHKSNSHHFEYHEEKNIDFSELDICEMCCDMFAKSIDHNNDPIEYLEKNLLPKSKFIQKHKENIIFILNLLKELNK